MSIEGGLNVRGYGATEKDEEGMALKILARAEDMPDGEDNLDAFRNRAGISLTKSFCCDKRILTRLNTRPGD